MSQELVTCPKCLHAFAPTAAMSASIEASLRAEFASKYQKDQQELAKQREIVAAKESQVARDREQMESTVATRVNEERNKLTQAAQSQAREDAKHEVTALQQRNITLQKEMQEKDAAAAAREEGVRKREAQALHRETDLAEKERNINLSVDAKLRAERAAIELRIREEQTKATGDQLAAMQAKIEAAEQGELDQRRKIQALQDQNRTFELQKQRELDAERANIRETAYAQAADENRLKIAEKDKLLSDMSRQMEEMRRKSEQVSQQLQGEVQELDLEATLRTAFARDTIEPVPKGTFGGDALHRVSGPLAANVGTILWESKRTKNWSDLWLAKLRGDQREARAEFCVIVTSTLPKGISSFGMIEGVWVCDLASAVPLASLLRHALVEIAAARQSAQGKQGKMELVYNYLTGQSFRQRVDAIREAFESMREDLEAEKKVITKQWAKRAKQIEMVVENTAGLYGDLQGIAGTSMPQIDGLEMKSLPS